MRILYGAGNCRGSNIRLGRFLKHCPKRHEIRVAAYVRNHQYCPYINWALNVIRNSRPHPKKRISDLIGDYDGKFPNVDLDRFECMLAELTEWDPQLVISDAEPVTAHIAKAFCTQLWLCSPLHLLNGVDWEFGHINRSRVLQQISNNLLRTLPKADKILVYSPFADLSARPLLKKGFEWVTPYIDPNNNEFCTGPRIEQPGFKFIRKMLDRQQIALTTGETCLVADAFYQQKIIAVSPDSQDAETVLNAALCEYFGFGRNLGEIGKDISYSNNQLKLFQNSKFNSVYLSKQKWGKLHDKLSNM